MKNKSSKALLIVIVLIFILTISSLVINIFAIFSNNNSNKDNSEVINYNGEWIQENDYYFSKLTLNENNKAKLEIISKDGSKKDYVHDVEYYNEQNTIVLYGDSIDSMVYFKKDKDTLCYLQKDCVEDNKFVRNVNNRTFEKKKIEKDDLLKLEKDAVSMNLDSTLNDESIEKKYSNYNETDDQITIYLFRGKGCGYCKAFLTFLSSITQEYGKYFKLKSFEVWYNENNSALMNEVAKYLNEPAEGVPYIVIGDKVFAGYTTAYDEDIKTAITNLYNIPKENRIDILK